jgi:hypothetical protein
LEITNQSPGPLPSLLLPPARGSCSVRLCRRQRCTSGRRFTAAAAPPPAEIFSTRRLLPIPVHFLSPGGLSRARHAFPSRSPAATISPSLPALASARSLASGLNSRSAPLCDLVYPCRTSFPLPLPVPRD